LVVQVTRYFSIPRRWSSCHVTSQHITRRITVPQSWVDRSHGCGLDDHSKVETRVAPVRASPWCWVQHTAHRYKHPLARQLPNFVSCPALLLYETPTPGTKVGLYLLDRLSSTLKGWSPRCDKGALGTCVLRVSIKCIKHHHGSRAVFGSCVSEEEGCDASHR
jgi:hypothetical protein